MTSTIVSPAETVTNMTPNYEVRLLLDPDAVLSSKLELADTVLSTFHVASTTKMNVQFLDTCSKDIYTAGWSARIRKAENDDLELTYKKRDSGTDLPGESKSRKLLIDEAPNKFDNWYPNKWGTSALAISRIFGPVLVTRFVGKWNDLPLNLEVWPLLNSDRTGIEYIIEASFKTDSRTTASVEGGNLVAYLQNKNWFLAQDSLKTQLIMERYGRAKVD
ncbi:hypothetical protein N7522_003508 [Penicillium canescens]|nr:hypothetical protein N7522_003508 [Penicillium canescens]